MRVAIFGGTGRVGRRLIEYALGRGHAVTALVRRPDALRATFDAAELTVVAGDVLDPFAVSATMADADAVLSALGGAGLADPGRAISGGMRNIVAAASAVGTRRVLAVAGSGVLDAESGGLRHDQPEFPAVFRPISLEHLGTYERLRASGLDWTLACTPDLADGERTGRYRLRRDRLPEGGHRITVGDVADFMVDEMAARRHVGTRVGLAE